MEDVPAASSAPMEAPKLPQSEAIMEAIIKSTKPIELPGSRAVASSSTGWSRAAQQMADRLVPWRRCRWITFTVLVALLILRVYRLQVGYFVIYLLAIYILNQLLLFLSPVTEGDGLPAASTSDEYRPFARALSEFWLWVWSFAATFCALVSTWTNILELDVDGTILFLYFLVVFTYTMKQQIFDMIRRGYVPWSGRKVNKPAGKALDV
mmetsp:Transcript_26874/g.61979  ORF Transcript_26874/g.61979 Transcript_26874/m.61979 type:complete len:209 (-) Transcript_26874:12-638(-)